MAITTKAGHSYLGIEGGATRTVALLADKAGNVIKRIERGPANLRLLTDLELIQVISSIASEFRTPSAVAIGMAGAWTSADCERLHKVATKAWREVPIHVTNDLETALAAGSTVNGPLGSQVLILSGTGSSCYGRTRDGKPIKVGGWGHILGDKGSGYEIGLRALKAVCYYFDRDGKWPRLGRCLLRALLLNEPHDLVAWVQNASKAEIAGLAVEVLNAWQNRDAIATDIVKGAAASLAADGVACAKRIEAEKNVQFVLAGSVLLKSNPFAARVARELRKLMPSARATPLSRESVWGAVALAQSVSVRGAPKLNNAETPVMPHSKGLSITEQRNPRSIRLDKLSVCAAVKLMIREEKEVQACLERIRPQIIRSITRIVRKLKSGGRLFYVGAGTSGRLGVLDASECPPTFRVNPDMVQGVIAGGQAALWKSIEGAEDDRDAGAQALKFRAVTRKDIVVGIAASGATPFVWGAFGEAHRVGADSILLCFNPNLEIPRPIRPTEVIQADAGPEILTGSTRLKAGTATKLVLNMFTTIAMVRLGKVMSNLMIDVAASNTKLKDRATRILQELTRLDYDAARSRLIKNEWIISKAAGRRLKKLPSLPTAVSRK